MRRSASLSVLALVICQFVQAAPLHVELPKPDWILPPDGPPPLLQREGTALSPERSILRQILPLLTSHEYESALAIVKAEHALVIRLLEQGDPHGMLAQMVVPGTPEGLLAQMAVKRLPYLNHQPVEPLEPEQISAALLYATGYIYLALKRYLPAETAFKRCLATLPDYVRVHESLGVLYLETERYDEARAQLSRAAELGLSSAHLYGELGYLNEKTRNYWGAVSAYQRAMMLESDNEQWRRGLLFSLSQTHQYDSALTLVEQQLQADPDNPELWLYRSSMALALGEKDVALASLETAIRLGDVSVANLQVCATLHMEQGSIDRAIELLKAGFAAGMEFRFIDQALDWLARNQKWDYLSQMLGNLRERWDTLSDVQKSRVLTAEASVSLSRNEKQAAKTALQRALDLDPGNARALVSLGEVLRKDRAYSAAELLFERASAYDSEREDALISLANLAIDQDDFERALQLLRTVVRSNPSRTDLVRNIDSLENLVRLQTD